jgi:hypothetical protein
MVGGEKMKYIDIKNIRDGFDLVIQIPECDIETEALKKVGLPVEKGQAALCVGKDEKAARGSLDMKSDDLLQIDFDRHIAPLMAAVK